MLLPPHPQVAEVGAWQGKVRWAIIIRTALVEDPTHVATAVAAHARPVISCAIDLSFRVQEIDFVNIHIDVDSALDVVRCPGRHRVQRHGACYGAACEGEGAGCEGEGAACGISTFILL